MFRAPLARDGSLKTVPSSMKTSMTSILIGVPPLATTVAVLIIVILTASTIRKKRQWTSKDGYPLPPGPPACWFWDSVMPRENISATFNSWANEYGPVFTLRQGSHVSVIIGRVDAATEIMEKEGSALVDRPLMIAAGDFLSGGKRITLVGSGERFRRLRKAVHTHFQPKAVLTYKDIQFQEAKTLVLDILNDPKNYHKHTHRFAASVVLRVTYGKSSPTSFDDPEFVEVKQVVKHFIEGMRPGAYLVDRFHWLKYMPGYGRRLKGFYKSDLKFYQGQLNRVKRAMSLDDTGSSFSRTLLENVKNHGMSFNEMAFLAGTTFEAGSDTTSGVITAMIMAAACFPEAQLRVQEELDAVVGRDRLPDWNDWNDLPQLHAFVSEVHRWRPATPLGFPHRSTRDIVWRGYYIPAGATIIGNHWAIGRDPVAFPDPEKFDPQRWLDRDGQLRSDLNCYPFGFGRRVCPGMHLVNRSLFITLALLLWSFRIAECPEAPIDTTPDRDSIVSQLPYFEVDFVHRAEEAHLRGTIAT